MTVRLRRCAHFIPGASEKMLGKGLDTEADALVLDLEDAVVPELKDEARGVIAGWLADADFGRHEKVVRINPVDSPWFRADVEATMVNPPDAYLVPKVHGPDDVRLVDRVVSDLERQHGHPENSVKLIVLGTETPRGLLAVDDLVCVPRIDALTWGAEDLSAAIGARRNRDADGRYLPLFEHARTMTMLAAAAAGVQPLDTVWVDVTDPEGLRARQRGERVDGLHRQDQHPPQPDRRDQRGVHPLGGRHRGEPGAAGRAGAEPGGGPHGVPLPGPDGRRAPLHPGPPHPGHRRRARSPAQLQPVPGSGSVCCAAPAAAQSAARRAGGGDRLEGRQR